MTVKPVHVLLLASLMLASCKKKEEKKSSRRQNEEALQRNSSRHLSVTKFADALREILKWRQQQTSADKKALATELVKKFEAVPVNGLPEDLLAAWQEVLKAWRTLAAEPSLSAEQRAAGAKAAEMLNQKLAERGIVDVRL